MEHSSWKNTQRRGVRPVNGVSLSVNESISTALRRWSVKFISRRVQASPRTIEKWREGKAGPQVRHVAAMLQDAELGPAVLTAMGRADLATHAEILSLNQRLDALKADEVRHREHSNEIRRTLEGVGVGNALAGRAVQRGGDDPTEGS